jgi:HEAT repeat protein
METQFSPRSGEELRTWINSNLFSNVSTLTRIRCLLDLCDGIDRADGEFTEDALIQVLEKDIDPIVRHEAAFTLYKLYNRGQISGERALKSLCNSAYHDVSTVARHESAESLGFFRHPQAFETLNELLKDPNPDVVATARISLERLSEPSSG